MEAKYIGGRAKDTLLDLHQIMSDQNRVHEPE
jgi:hypothetical protein